MAPQSLSPNKNKPSNPKLTTIDIIGGILCSTCKVTFRNKKDYDKHYAEHSSGQEILYTCVVCLREIPGYASFRGHCYTSHVIKSRFNCKICSKNFSKQSALMDHEESMHRFKCPSPCNKEFKSRQDFQLHQIIHKDNGGPPYPCQKCEEKINSIDSCEKHILKHTLVTYSCPICSSVFPDKIKAGQHLTEHFEGETLEPEDSLTPSSETDCATSLLGIQCGQCDKEFKTKIEIDTHFEWEHNDSDVVYTCTVCTNNYSKYSMFARHCYHHMVKKKYKCESCSKSFTRLSLLVTHAHSLCGARWSCPRCGDDCPSERALRDHVRDHHGLDLLPCAEPGCQRAYHSVRDLVLHKITHKSIGKFCKQCGLEFKSLASCINHLEVHRTSVFTCPICSKTFNDTYRAIKHAPHHFQSVLHVCKVCGKIYNAKYRLVEHSKTHSETRSYECDVCSKKFTTSDNLKQHMNTHTGDKPYKCARCDRAFTSYSNFHKHTRRMHNADPKTVKKTAITTNDANDCHRLEENEIEAMESTCVQPTNDTELNPNVLEEPYMSVQSVGSDAGVELEVIEPSILEEASQFILNEMKSNFAQLNNWVICDVPGQGQGQGEPPAAANYPREYGPDFINYPAAGGDLAGQVIDLDDHMLPHIDPMLPHIDPTVPHIDPQHAPKDHSSEVPYLTYGRTDVSTDRLHEKWEPPIITKIFKNYTYDAMPNILSAMKTDIYY